MEDSPNSQPKAKITMPILYHSLIKVFLLVVSKVWRRKGLLRPVTTTFLRSGVSKLEAREILLLWGNFSSVPEIL